MLVTHDASLFPATTQPAHWREALRLWLTPCVGPQAARKLWQACGSLSAIQTLTWAQCAELVGAQAATALQTEPLAWAAQCERTQQWLVQADQGLSHAVWTWDDDGYPVGLLALHDAPLLVYARGQLQRPLGPALAVVGSRNPTHQGRENARAFAHSLSAGGYAVVSGMAMGIDAAAHLGAMQADAGGHCPTVAVVGTGLDQVYPRQHLGLSQDIAACGWVISELPLGTQPLAHHFPQRNRLIAGLSQGVLVVEAALKSGSLITAQLALDQGKEVFAIPGSIHSALSRGCHALLRQGAKLVENTQDIVEEMPPINGLPMPPWEAYVPDVLQKPDAQALWSVMGDEALSVDVLVLRSGMAVPQVLAVLHELQEHACVAMNSAGSYQRIQRSKV